MLPANFQAFLDFIYVPVLNLNFVDILIIVVIIIYAIEGYAVGLVRGLADFTNFVISFFFALSFYSVFSVFLVDRFNMPQGFSNAIGFFIAAIICYLCISILFRSLVLPFVHKKTKKNKLLKEGDKITGIVPGVLSAVVLLAFILTLVIALPISTYLKNSVSQSKFGSPLVSSIQGFDSQLNNVFGGAINEAITFLTVEPKSDEILELNFTTTETFVDLNSEDEMLVIINKERQAIGLPDLNSNEALKTVARNHCTDMLARGYFSHYTPEGTSPFDRMNEANINFEYAGENLALAPNSILAMKGLMNSQGHRENILSENFGKIGVGVIDAGLYGKMFCQEFND